MSERLLYSIAEAAEILGKGKTTGYEMARTGYLETVVVGSQRMVPADALRRLIDQLRAESASAGAGRILALVDEDGRIEVGDIPSDVTLADLAEAKRVVELRRLQVA